MNILLSKPKRVVRNFRQEHGDMEGWTADDFGLLHDLLVVVHAKPGPLRRARLRAQTLAVIAYGLPLYAVDELVHALRGTYWTPLGQHLDRVDDRYIAAEAACTKTGDSTFVARVGSVTGWIADAVWRITHSVKA